MPKEEKQVVMARAIAQRWLAKVATAEYRVRVMYSSREYRNLPNLLRAFRDGKVRIAGMTPVKDLGVREEFDFVEVWSRDHAGILRLGQWFEKQGFDTTGIW